AAAERSLHEADQEDAREGDQDRGDCQLQGHRRLLASSEGGMKPCTAALICERSRPMSRRTWSSSSRRLAMAARRTKQRAIPSRQAPTTRANAPRLVVTSGRTIVAGFADISGFPWLLRAMRRRPAPAHVERAGTRRPRRHSLFPGTV